MGCVIGRRRVFSCLVFFSFGGYTSGRFVPALFFMLCFKMHLRHVGFSEGAFSRCFVEYFFFSKL
jgi:hypothetical protein